MEMLTWQSASESKTRTQDCLLIGFKTKWICALADLVLSDFPKLSKTLT
jgi:hypothetical protein